MSGYIELETGKEKIIVMPLQPETERQGDGIGLGLHFLLGNLFCLHPGLLECWFGWRVKKIFPKPSELITYCNGGHPFQEINKLGQREKVRFWVEGTYKGQDEALLVEVVLHDTRDDIRFDKTFQLDRKEGVSGFRKSFLEWLDDIGLGLGTGGNQKAQWLEPITLDGLNYLGRALQTLYINYVDGTGAPIDLENFEKSASLCPDSYLTQDLLGWGLYKNELPDRANQAFSIARSLNPDGLGALSGLMWCAVTAQDRKNALKYALEKGRCRDEDPQKAKIFVDKKFA